VGAGNTVRVIAGGDYGVAVRPELGEAALSVERLPEWIRFGRRRACDQPLQCVLASTGALQVHEAAGTDWVADQTVDVGASHQLLPAAAVV
jgi:hypothetical protein